MLEFWYEFASPYSYPCAMRIEGLARRHDIPVAWRPFLLGPIFESVGWPDSPFNLYPAKGQYMWRDIERTCARLNLPFVRPTPFPQNGLLAARVAVAVDEAMVPAFSRAVYHAEFGVGRNIAGADAVRQILVELGLDPDHWLGRAGQTTTKQVLRDQTTMAAAHGIFGAPSLRTPDGELFWGNDRLEEALQWIAAHGSFVTPGEFSG